MSTKDRVIIVGADYHGDWPKDTYLAFKELGVPAELVFTNTIFKGTDNNTDVSKRVKLEKIKQIFRNHARFIFNFVKEQRRLMSEREVVKRIRASHKPGERSFVIFLWTPPSVAILKRLKKIEGIVLVMWQGEAPVREARWPLSFPYFDRLFSVGKEWIALLDPEVQKKTSFLALASNPAKFFPLSEDKRDPKFASDIAFVGYYLEERAEFLSALKDLDLKIYGYWWENGMAKFPWLKEKYVGPLSNEDANQAFNGGKIQVGRAIGTASYGTSITQRVFDVSLAGNFQISGYSFEMVDMFGDVTPLFRDAKELREKVDHYLAHPEERARSAAKAHEMAMNAHTYQHRAKTMIEVLGIRK